MFTQQELDDAIAKLVRTSIRRQYGALGNRRIDLTFDDTKDAAAGIFILFPNAPFYVVKLASDRLAAAVASLILELQSFVGVVRAVDRRVAPIDNLAPLANARSALDALSAALAARSTAFSNLPATSAYQRFDANTRRFLEESGVAIRAGGDIVPTPVEARRSLGSLVTSIRVAHSDIIRRTQVLVGAVDDYSSMNLPGLLSSTIISNARNALSSRFDELAALSADARLEIIRAATLDVLAARSTIRGFGSLSAPATFLSLDGEGSVFADAAHPAAPAALASLAGPFNVVPYLGVGNGGDLLDFTVEGTPIVVQMLGSFVAKLEGTVKEPFDIGNPSGLGLINDTFDFTIKNYPTAGASSTFTVTFGSDTTKSARELCDEINSVIPNTVPLLAEPYANPLKFLGNVDIDVTAVPNDARFTSTNPATDFSALGVKAGDRLIVRGPVSTHKGAVYQVAIGGVGTSTLDCDYVAGPISGVDELNKTIELGDGKLAVRFRITDVRDAPRPEFRISSLNLRTSIFLPQTQAGNVDLQRDTLNTMGFVPVMEVFSSPSPARETANLFNRTQSTSVGGVARISAEAVFSPSIYQGQGRTEPNDFLLLVITKFRESGSVTAGTSVTFTAAGALTAGVDIGDIVVLRSHPVVSSVGVKGTITAVDDISISATMDVAVTAASVDIEVGPDLTLPLDSTALVSGGTANDGEYVIKGQRAIPFELDLVASFPLPNDIGNQPIFFDVALGLFSVVFSSTNITTATALSVLNVSTGSVLTEFFSVPTNAVGSTTFFRLPEVPKNLEEGDILELYPTQYNVPASTSVISEVDPTLELVTLETSLPTSTPAFAFSVDSPVPFARIRKRKLDTYLALKSELVGWLLGPEASVTHLDELDRLLNALIANQNPTVVQVNEVVSFVETLIEALTELGQYLDGYVASPVPQVDELLQTFREKGADRAVDIILEARFSDFFGLSHDVVSYSGMLQKSIRDVEREDLPIRKTNRAGRASAESVTLAAYDETDFEYDQADIDHVEEPDIPGAQGVPFPGQSY